MRCELYYNKSDRRYIKKVLEPVIPAGASSPEFNIEILEDSSIENPRLVLSTPTNSIQANYMFIPDLARYYYIDEVTLSNGRLIVTASVDVLMSFQQEILATWVVLDRQEAKFNLYLPDNMLPVEVPTNVRTIKFPGSFQAASEFILVLAGSNSSEEPEPELTEG